MASSIKGHSSKRQLLSETSEDVEDILNWVKDKNVIGKVTRRTKMNVKDIPKKGISESKEITVFEGGKNIDTNNLTRQLDNGNTSLQMEKDKISEADMKAISFWIKQKESLSEEVRHTKAEVKAALMKDVFNGMTSADADAAFEKYAKGRNYVDIEEFQDVLAEMARMKNVDVTLLHRQLANAPPEEYLHPKKGWRRNKS